MKKTKQILMLAFWGIASPLLMAQASWTDGITEAGTFDLPNADPRDIFVNLLLWLLMMFTILAVLAFVISGIMFLTAGANSNNAQRAKDMVTYSIIGIVIGLSGYIIIALIDGILLANIW